MNRIMQKVYYAEKETIGYSKIKTGVSVLAEKLGLRANSFALPKHSQV